MDPNAAYIDWLTAESHEDACEAAENLLNWLNMGGFEPDSVAPYHYSRSCFVAWCKEAGVV